jgi:sialic acid synthase SpsE/sugar phosphate isomerase/epimerase
MPRVMIIAEIGINHNGSYEIAKELIHEAGHAGVHAIKFQYRNLDNAYSEQAREIGDQILSREIEKNYLAPESILSLTEIAQAHGIQAGISFFERTDIGDFCLSIKAFDFFKVPSAELVNSELIDSLLETGKPVFLSTGCHNEAQLELAFSRLPETGWTPMHCISNYPTSLHNARLGYISHMRRRWEREVGYSSHDDNWEVCLMAMQLGATVIERHITLDKRAEGLDHSSSSTPEEFKKLCNFAENFDLLMAGDSVRAANQGELMNLQNLGRSYFASRDIMSGETLSPDSVVYRAPSTGLGKQEIKRFWGSETVIDVKKGEPISYTVFELPEQITGEVTDFAKSHVVGLPVRLHDFTYMRSEFPIEAYEFHLSFDEVRSDIDVREFDKDCRYSVHLPDYVNSTLLMDPFSPDPFQRDTSRNILQRTVCFASDLQERTGQAVPVVGSFSVVHSTREAFFAQHAELLSDLRAGGVIVMPQWLPPVAWYFGGSVTLHAMNSIEDANLLIKYELPVCLDICHLLMGQNFFGFSAIELMQNLQENIKHIHIADAVGIDGEGIAIGEGEPGNIDVIKQALAFPCMKIVEVWQGHLDRGAGFREALKTLTRI